MDQPKCISKVNFSMNLVVPWFITYILLSSDVSANVDFYPDVTPEDYVIEQLARRILQENEHRPYGNPGTISELRPEPDFTYRFPERSPNSGQSSEFAVNPSDPKYYENENSLRVADSLFPRQSKSDEDYDRAVFDSGQELKPESPTQRPPLQTEGQAAGRNEVPEASDFTSKATLPNDSQVYRTLVPVDADDKSDLYFIAIVAGCSAAAVVGVIAIGISWYKFSGCQSTRSIELKNPSFRQQQTLSPSSG